MLVLSLLKNLSNYKPPMFTNNVAANAHLLLSELPTTHLADCHLQYHVHDNL